MRLTYNKVFDKYTMSFSDKIAEISYSLYRMMRLRFKKYFLFQNTRNIDLKMICFQKKNLRICRMDLIT